MIMKENKIRNKQVNLRLTEAEYRRLDAAAQASGLGRSAYLRMVLYGFVREPKKQNRNCVFCTISRHEGAEASAVGGNRKQILYCECDTEPVSASIAF